MHETRRLANWRTYLHDYPWACVGAAVAVGYLAVPNRPQIVTPNPDDLAKLAKRNQLVVKQSPKGTTTQNFARTSATFLGNMLLRAAVAFIGQQVGRVGVKAADPHGQ
ncbi:MAG: hypothetical protein DWQ37_03050 [Planctomycetota bacterium]|nr:MAG: hypothetical protein DWQ37_03050 [Planctomycetota bacterium]